MKVGTAFASSLWARGTLRMWRSNPVLKRSDEASCSLDSISLSTLDGHDHLFLLRMHA